MRDGWGATLSVATPELSVTLAAGSQVAVGLKPHGADGFDFVPSDRPVRAAEGYHHLGDLLLRVRVGGGPWRDLSTATSRRPVRELPRRGATLAAADLAPTLPPDCPLRIVRAWVRDGAHLSLRFTLTNPGDAPVEIGALGMPMVFNNLITDRSLDEAHARCSFFDPYVGQDAGYLQVTRLSGKGPALVVVPDGKSPFEGWQPLTEPMRPNQTFEGTYAWMVHTRAYAEREWKAAEPWNPPTSATIAPGESVTYGVKLLLAPEIRAIEATLAAAKRPVAVGVPGTILPMDVDARLFLRYGRPVRKIDVAPAGAVEVAPLRGPRGWQAFALRGKRWGRARLEVTYGDGTLQTVHAYVIKPMQQAVADLGRFLFTRQWFEQPDDPFGRSPSVISYDRQADRQVTQDSRVWIAGLGDEGGSGSWLAAGMKLFAQPDRGQVAQYERFVGETLWGRLQFKDGPNAYGVRKSLFYYQPDELPTFPYDPQRNWKTWTSWNKRASEDIGRGYNYPHVVAAYWALYRVARNRPGMTSKPWQWYLEQAQKTTAFMFGRDAKGERRVGYVELGLMEGTIFLELLRDLQREGWGAAAAQVEGLMRERADRWKKEAYPFGSEMAWDSTGQEEVYAWCRHFGHEDKAQVSLSSILGYMPTLPHWGYNGNARRYWDFLYGGKTTRIERQLHHYGSGLNAIPVLAEYRRRPDDLYLLRVGYGGAMGALSNIDPDGFASAAFHAFPSTLTWDAYSGDYGPNFLGHALNAATYLVKDPTFGWQSFGGNVTTARGEKASVAPKDALRQRVFVAPLGLWLTLDAGRFASVDVDLAARTAAITLEPAEPDTPRARLRIEANVGEFRPTQTLPIDAGAYTIPLGTAPVRVEVRPG